LGNHPSLGGIAFDQRQEVRTLLERVSHDGGSSIHGHESFEIRQEEVRFQPVASKGLWGNTLHLVEVIPVSLPCKGA
jgi:hypothetical protein